MIIRVVIISTVIVTFSMLALGIRLLLDPKAEFSRTCALEDGEGEAIGKCAGCQLKDLTACAEDNKS